MPMFRVLWCAVGLCLLAGCPRGEPLSDYDGDGVLDDSDCVPDDASIYPGAPELCDDGVDNDCDGLVDEQDDECAGGDDDDTADDDDTSSDDDDSADDDDDTSDDDDDTSDDDDDTSDDDDDTAAGCDIHVPADHATIQAAISAAADYDVVCVAAGTYNENLDFLGKPIHVLGVDGPAATLVDAGGNGAVVSFHAGEGMDAVLEGFTLTGGWSMLGGGISVQSSSPVLQGLIVRDNAAEDGGGLGIDDGDPFVEDVIFEANDADSGGGIAVFSGNPRMFNVVLVTNTGGEGGAMLFHQGSGEVTGAIVAENSATARGGGVLVVQGSPLLTNMVIYGNRAETGGGIFLANSTLDVANLIVTENAANNQGGGVLNQNSYPDFYYCDVWNNLPENYYGMTDPTGTSGNVSVDPVFQDLSAPDVLDYDFHLASASPLIDGGHTNFTDPDGSTSDPGAYGQAPAASWDLDRDGFQEWWMPGAYDFANYPALGWDCEDQDPGVYPGSGC